MIRIVHLSDTHLNKRHILDIEQSIVPALIYDLKQYNNLKSIDFVFFSGDLIDKGGESFENNTGLSLYTFMDRIIVPLINELNLPQDRIFFAPGNHDIDRTADTIVDEVGLRNLLNTTDKVNEIIDSQTEQGIRRILPFKNFEKDYYKNYSYEHNLSNYQSCFKVLLNDQSVGIACFNSAWRCSDGVSDKMNILLGERQVTNARKLIHKCDIKIAILHHPLDWLSKFDYESVTSLIQKDYDMIFCGHIHEGSSWSKTDMYGNLFVSIAPSNWKYYMRSGEQSHFIGYSIVDYDHVNLHIKVHNRRYSHKKGCFDPNTDLGNEKGEIVYALPDSTTLSIRNIETRIVKTLGETRLNDINDHLLSSNTDTLAPKDINGLFVMPRIVDCVQYDITKVKNEKVFNIGDIININDNIIIFGMKESGKTILLDKLLMEMVINVQHYHRLPVFCDFDEIFNKRFESIISSYLGVNIINISEFLITHKIILLIDNISFDNNELHKLNRLNKFIKKYSNVKLICTSNQRFEGDVPLEFYYYEPFSSFKIMHMKHFQTGQIRELIIKWFSNNINYDISDKLEKIVKTLLAINIPRTPMSISIFLWIIEQTENYKPINHATMLENFIQRLFRKLSKKDIYSEEFDYKNKERLLAEIAYFMFERNDDNYNLPYIELGSFIDETLREKKFDFESSDVLEYFLSKGILIRENVGGKKSIRFRFNCFFEYFLMKKMDFDPNFKKYVLRKGNYFHFYNEIDYYTGIKRDQSDILILLIDRMNAIFKEVFEYLEKYKIDDFFKVRKSLVSKLDEGFLNKLVECGKPDEKALDEMTDEMLMVTTEKGIERKQLGRSPFNKYEEVLTLAAIVLKNTEETIIKDLKSNSYRDIMRCAGAYTIITKLAFDHIVSRCDKCIRKTKECTIKTSIMRSCMPFITQLLLYYVMATGKLRVVIKEKIDSDNSNVYISDLEKFLSVFLYSDIKGKDFTKYLTFFVKNIRHQYIYDISLIKILQYYFLRSKSRTSDLFYERLIAELMVRSKKAKKGMKSELMRAYKRGKEKFKEVDEEFIL